MDTAIKNSAKLAALVLILLSASLLYSFLNSLNFSKTGFRGFIGEGFSSSAESYENYAHLGYDISSAMGDNGFAAFSNLKSPFNPPNVPLFYVEGLDNTTNYLRLYTASKYIDGVWMEDSLTCTSPSNGEKIYKITPIVNLTKYLPVAKDTKAVIPQVYTCYDSDKGVFTIKSTKQPYFGFSSTKIVHPTRFDGSDFYPDEELRELAMKITANATTDYEKVLAIESYLKKNYVNTYIEPPKEGDPVKYFLFVSKKGTAREFASAFVLLAKSIGVPARVVFGYLADPTPVNQTIFASDAYVWAEVKFAEGWVEFDPTPPSTGLETITEITHVDEKIIAGKEFNIEGYVIDERGNPVSGYVEIFFKKRKEDREGILVGIIHVENGEFKATLVAPNVTGEYQVVAHYTGSMYYKESWSDPRVKVYFQPTFSVELPERVATSFKLKGQIKTVEPYTGYITLCVDNSCRNVRVTEGNFSYFLKLSPGIHKIQLRFDGRGYLLPAEFVKDVEVGEVEVQVNSTVAENVTGFVTFNHKPVNATIVLNGVKARCVNGKFEANVQLELGKNVVNVSIPEFLYEGKIVVYKKQPVVIDAKISDGKLEVFVHSKELPADGYVEFLGVKKLLIDGRAEFRIPDDFKGGKIIYYGSDRFLPAEKEIVRSNPLPILAFAAIAAILASYFFLRTRKKDLKIFVEKEHPKLPNIWDVGEVVKISLEEPATLRVNGKTMSGSRFELKFDSYGVKRIVAEKDGKRGELEIKIAPYSEAIAEVLKLLESKLKNANVNSMTAREVAKALGIKSSKLLRYFELAKYGGKNVGRREFLEAFYDYLKVVGNEDS